MSVRCKNFEPALDLAAYSGLKLRLLGNGLRYKCIIRTDAGWDGVGYCRWVLELKPTFGSVGVLHCAGILAGIYMVLGLRVVWLWLLGSSL